jgi:hypothetical protein
LTGRSREWDELVEVGEINTSEPVVCYYCWTIGSVTILYAINFIKSSILQRVIM